MTTSQHCASRHRKASVIQVASKAKKSSVKLVKRRQRPTKNSRDDAHQVDVLTGNTQQFQHGPQEPRENNGVAPSLSLPSSSLHSTSTSTSTSNCCSVSSCAVSTASISSNSDPPSPLPTTICYTTTQSSTKSHVSSGKSSLLYQLWVETGRVLENNNPSDDDTTEEDTTEEHDTNHENDDFERKVNALCEQMKDLGEWGVSLYHKATPPLKDDPRVVKAFVEIANYNGCLLDHLPLQLRDNESIVRAAVRRCGHQLAFASNRLQDSESIVLEAVQSNGQALSDASHRLRDNEQIVLAACRSHPLALHYASWRLQASKRIVTEAVKNNGLALAYANSFVFRNDRDIVALAVTTCGTALQHASRLLQNDRQIALLAVQNDGRAIQYVGKALRRNDREIVLAAVQTFGDALGYVSGHLPRQGEHFFDRNNPLDDHDNDEFEDDSPLLDDREIVLTAVKNSGASLEYASRRLQNDKEVVMEAVINCSSALKHASFSLRDNRDIVFLAVLNGGEALEYASQRLQCDKEIAILALSTCKVSRGNVLNDVGDVRYATSSRALQFVPRSLCDDAETMLTIFEQTDWCYEMRRISPRLRENEEFVLDIAQISIDAAIKFASKELKNDQEFIMKLRAQGKDRNNNNGQEHCTNTAGSNYKNSSDHQPQETHPSTLDAREAKYLSCREIKERESQLLMEAIKYNGVNILWAPEEVRANREVVREAIKTYGCAIGSAKRTFLLDRELILEAVRSSGEALQYAGPKLRLDREIVSEAVKQNGMAILHADSQFLGDKQLVIQALSSIKRGDVEMIINQLPKELLVHRDVFCAAVGKSTGVVGKSKGVLGRAPAAFQDDEELVMQGIRYEFMHASNRLRAKKSVAIAAVEASPQNMTFVGRELLMDSEVFGILAGKATLSNQLRRLGWDELSANWDKDEESSRQDWVEILVKANKIGNIKLSISTMFYLLAHNPTLMFHC